MSKSKKSAKKEKLEHPALVSGGRHGVYDVQMPMMNEPSRPGRHSGRAVPMVTTSLGGDKLPSGENGGLVGAGDVVAPSIDLGEQNLPKHLRGGASTAYAAGATPTPAAAQN